MQLLDIILNRTFNAMVARSNRARPTIKDLQNQVLTNYRRAFFMSEISRGTLAGQFGINNHNKTRYF